MEQGILRFIIYKRPKNKYFTGVCLDLDIVEEGKDLIALRKSLEEAAFGYIEVVLKKELDKRLLNRPAPKKYWKILNDIEKYIHSIKNTPQRTKTLLPVIESYTFTTDIATV